MNKNLNKKQIFIIGFIVILLIGIPLTVYLIQKQQEVRTHAQKATNITFSPTSDSTNPIRKNVGDLIPLDVTVNPGTNLVSFVKLEIRYDPDKLATDSANAFKPNTIAFPTVLEGPIYSAGKIAITLSVGPDPTKAIQTTTKAGTLTLKALANTPPGTPTLVEYGTNTQVLSTGPSDEASENVLAGTTPATIVIGGSVITSPTSGIPTLEPIPTAVPSQPIPEQPTTPPSEQPTQVPLPTEVPLATPTTAGGGGGTGGGGTVNQSPVCTSLIADRDTTGSVPLSITFTASGTDSDGTISKVTYNFGDGQVSDVTAGGGLGTASVRAQISHTFNNPATYRVSAVLTDNQNAVNTNSTNCTLTVTATASGSATPAPTLGQGVTIPPTGSMDIALGIGALALVLIVGGGLLFFIL